MVQSLSNIAYIGENESDFLKLKTFLQQEKFLYNIQWEHSIDQDLDIRPNHGYDLYILEYNFIILNKEIIIPLLEKLQSQDNPILLLYDRQYENCLNDLRQKGFSDYLLREELDQKSLIKSIDYALQYATLRNKYHAAKRKFEIFASISPIGVFKMNAEGHLFYTNTKYQKLVSNAPEELNFAELNFFDTIHDNDLSLVQTSIQKILETEDIQKSIEFRLKNPQDNIKWISAQFAAYKDKKETSILGTLTDISEVKQAETRLVYEATHDKLTGLPNRGLFFRQA
jgi:PAS domain S-box-containing protein